MTKSTITGLENGPYLISGTASYLDSNGNRQTTGGATIALCRCGASANKPFCDGKHRKIDFKAPKVELTVEHQ